MNTSALSFRSKLLMFLTVVIVGICGVMLYVAQGIMHTSYQRVFRRQFENEIAYFSLLQDSRLAAIKDQCDKLANSVRLVAAMNEDEIDSANLYQIAMDELREILVENPDGAQPGLRNLHASFFGFLDAKGKFLRPPKMNRFALLAARHRLAQELTFAQQGLAGEEQQELGYLSIVHDQQTSGHEKIGKIIARNSDGELHLQEVIVTKIVDHATGKVLGALVIGFPVPDIVQRVASDVASTNLVNEIQTGILLQNQLYANPSVIPETVRPAIVNQITKAIGHNPQKTSDDFPAEIGARSYRVFYNELNRNSAFPKAYQICLYSRSEELLDERELTNRILMWGSLALLGVVGLNLFLSHRFAKPIAAVAKGTEEIQKGNFGVRVPVLSRDEIGRLAESFNEMAEGLAQKEKYRSVLNLVADKHIAQELISGKLALGGEEREITVLFCDIRGFTALTQNMPPAEVVEMINEHMTALTQVVYENNGVIDKFMGDLVMAVFGAPKTYPNDTLNAARCALRMIEVRRELNKNSKHQIDVGIGLATGKVVAGCTGSTDRLNYTVLGERVNLASRLCGQAGRMEVLIDQTTKERLDSVTVTETLPPLKLKGFSDPMPAYKLREVRPVTDNK